MNEQKKLEFKEEHLRQVSLQKVGVLAKTPMINLLQSIDEITSNDLEGLTVLIAIMETIDSSIREYVSEETVLKIKDFIREQGEEKEHEGN